MVRKNPRCISHQFTTANGTCTSSTNGTRWCPSSLAKLVHITPINPMVYSRYNELVDGVYKPTNITWGHHPVCPFSIEIVYRRVHPWHKPFRFYPELPIPDAEVPIGIAHPWLGKCALHSLPKGPIIYKQTIL